MATARSFLKSMLIGGNIYHDNRPKFPGRRIRGGAICYCREAQGPHCLLVGPIDTERKEKLEALYCQASDAYYSGQPIILDDMFDRVESKLRRYGSKTVVKYPRCSIRRQSAYSDAEEDPPQIVALASIWMLILAFGSSTCLLPVIYVIGLAYQDAFYSGVSNGGQEFFSMVNGILLMMLGCVIGYPIASASVGVLQGLWRKDLVALKGACPNCGEEVFAFPKSDNSNSSSHKASCHIYDCSLEFRTKIEQPQAKPGSKWVYGQIFLVKP